MAAELPGVVGVLAAAWVAILGAAIGSFLNVIVARLPARESIVRPASRCPRCRTQIRWYDNLPIVSWIALRARCRHCGAAISGRYPVVEAMGAASALIAFARHGFSARAAAEFALVAALLALAFIDLETWLLPNAITWPLIAFGIALGALGVTPARSLRLAAYGAGLGFAGFALVAWLGAKVFRKEALGLGDVWLLAGLGAWMGPLALMPVVLFASVQGAIVGLALIALGKGEPGPPMPNAPIPPPGADESPVVFTRGVPPSEDGAGMDHPSPASTPAPDPIPLSVESPAEDSSEQEWIPPRNAVPFGPFLVAGALEWLWVGGVLAQSVPVLRLFR